MGSDTQETDEAREDLDELETDECPSERAASRGRFPLWRLVGLLLVAPAATALGFFAVLYAADPDLFIADSDSGSVVGVDGGGLASDSGLAVEVSTDDQDLAEGLLMRPAPSITMDEPYYWRCWESGKQAPQEEDACGRMRPLERVVASRLGEVVACFERLDTPGAKGTLSLAIDIDFGDGSEEELAEGKVKIWSGRSTTLEGSDSLITCLRSKISSLPIKGIRHKHQRYSIFFPIEFHGEKAGESSRPIQLVLDRVRLRESPVKGKIVARLKQGEPLHLYEIDEGWARVKTADSREGWVFIDAITLQE